jgi:hypothetical protein
MTQQESFQIALRKIKSAKTGKEIADAMIEHFKTFPKVEPKAPAYASAIDLLNAPLFGLEPSKTAR